MIGPMTTAEAAIHSAPTEPLAAIAAPAPAETAVAVRRPGSAATLGRLREMILSGELPPGTVISQLTLARILGVSTTPLREVIRELQVEGLLEVELNRRPRVAPLDVEDLHGVYAGRIVFESLAVAMTVPLMTEADFALLQADLEAMRVAAAAEDLGQWSAVHSRFHRRLVVEAPDSIAASIDHLAARSERYRRLLDSPAVPRNLADADRDHQRIARACVDRDASLAANELAHHLAHTALSLSATFAPGADREAVHQAVCMVSSSPEPAVNGASGKRVRGL